VIENGFPQNAPKAYFLTKIFHPNVAVPSGDICVNTLKRDWNPAKWKLDHIFGIIRCLLIVPFPESSLNEEAGR
jgi:ubiquitin-conjugating enzyme E2 S